MNNKIVKRVGLVILAMIAIGLGALAFIYWQPHRDVQATETDYSLKSSNIVAEYLANSKLANEKYLDEEGESKVLEISGKVFLVEEDYEGKTVVLLKGDGEKAGVACTLINKPKSSIDVGSTLKIKGVIRSGASFDEDLDMYENVIMEECEILN